MEATMKPCPFCGKLDKYPLISYITQSKDYVYSHFCKSPKLTICISVYGKTESDVIRRWNRRGEDGKEHIAE